ncbi:MAG: TIR domain-containing protein [Verrucomicrobiota bacterium]
MVSDFKSSIFIASSHQAIGHSERIGETLAKEGNLDVRLWSGEFPAGVATMEQLQRLTDEVVGAVILFTPDDIAKVMRKGVRQEKEQLLPCQNVAFEAGYSLLS